ncbi:putative PDK domain-containing protein [metagenome]|uniref:Putative PDK domain-containing protein n=1 Tax=metagenome TaxID=256318 RepID=A0A2P2BZC8_9ZZZZ
MRVVLGALLSAAVVTATAVVLPATVATAAPAADPTTIGTTAATAGGSCWEIKQLRPTATDGAYWLLTPTMTEPAQFYCDMTTDGGGWVLVGKGRDGWVNDYEGKGSAADLLTPGLTTMSAATSELASETVDALLGGGRVDALTDGVRLRRARDTSGSTWQESRFKFTNRDRWVWTFGAEHPLGAWSFDGVAGSGGQTASWGADQSYRRVNNTPSSSQTFHQGFAFGSSVAGNSSATSYLWSATTGLGGALPFTQVYLRPKVTSADARFTAIPDAGTAAITRPAVPRNKALDSPWAVSGIAGSAADEGNVEVQAFTQSGNTMYVGGNFRYVQQSAEGLNQVDQPYLAAFDVTTGELLTSFRPVLNEQVRTLATLPNGNVVAGGIFTQANGQPATGIVALDPVTGATATGFKLTIENRLTAGVLQIKSLDVQGGFLYIGGALTHMTGGTRLTAVYTRNLGRVSVTDGTPSSDWNPNINGTVSGVDASSDGQRVYASGYFGLAQGVAAKRAVSLSTASGAALSGPTWAPVWSNNNNDYQHALKQIGNRVYYGGSEHSLFGFDTDTLQRVSGSIMKKNGDVQAVADGGNGLVFAGCHCNNFSYQNAFTWSSLNSNWTQADALNWFGAWNAQTGARVPQFTPTMGMRLGSGIWAITTDTNGTVWAGGDIETVTSKSQANRFSGGFARWDAADATAPATPTNFRITSQTSDTVNLEWNTVSDPSGVHYQILRDDRTIGLTSGNTGSITVPKGGSGRFFLRAADAVGNVSSSTSVLVAGSGLVLPTASFTSTVDRSQVTVDGSGSTSPNGDIVDYLWDFGDASGARGATAIHTYLTSGSYVVRLTVTDAQGATNSTTKTVTVTAPVNAAPTDVYGKEIYRQSPWFYYRLAETSGSTATDAGPDGRNGTYSGTISRGVSGALRNSNNAAISLVGRDGFAVSPQAPGPPTEFSAGIWFKTTDNKGGRLIGYGSSSSGLSNSYDRHIYIQNDGRLVFGVYNGVENRVTTTGSYRDGVWHQAVATLSPTAGMKLYVDGALVGSNANTTAENFTGYWKVGGDNVWSGASSRYLTGSLDEAAVFQRALTPAEIAEQWRLGSTVVEPPVTTPPTASFTASVNSLTGTFDAGASSDTDGNIVLYRWDFGDGTTANGQLVSHTFPAVGDYTVSLTVTDNDGALGTTTKTVTTTAAPVDSVPIANGSTWQWRYLNSAPPAGWNTAGFDASSWSGGAAPLGFGAITLGTNIDTFASTADRPKAAYFTRSFDVADASKVQRLTLTTRADDGVVVYVNGVEVSRSNMPTGTITFNTFASTARKTSVAISAPLVIEVPVGLLTNGTNVISAETHLNYRNTPDFSFELQANMRALP